MTIGQNVFQRRKAAGLTQPQLAVYAGLSPTTVCHIERGEAEPTITTLRALGKALGCSWIELAKGD